MIARTITPKVLELVEKFPIVAITRPWQSGKTTLSKIIKPNHKYVNLENLSDREFAKTDPLGFLQTYQNGVIIDEIQNVPMRETSMVSTLLQVHKISWWWNKLHNLLQEELHCLHFYHCLIRN